MERETGSLALWIQLVIIFLIVALVGVALWASMRTAGPDPAVQRRANEMVRANFQAAGARAREARGVVDQLWLARAYLHRGLVDAALARQASAVTAALERLEALAESLGAAYEESGRASVAAQWVDGLKQMDRALLEAVRNYAVGDTPSYEAALASAAAAQTVVGGDAATLGALADYQAALMAYARSVVRGMHAPAYVELDKAVAASQAVGRALDAV